MLYFAYGSNLHPDQMRERCPGAKVMGPARLDAHELVFNRRSTTRNCGVSSVSPAPDSHVWGVVYDLTPTDVIALDRNEGYRAARVDADNGYNRRKVTVLLNEAETEVETYFATPHDTPPRPNATYIRLITAGARAHALPDEYLAWLDTIEHDPDTDS